MFDLLKCLLLVMILIKVAVGVILNDQKNQVFLTKRKVTQDLSELWEFPGGKLEANELPHTALKRELKEEVGIDVVAFSPLLIKAHHYEHKSVELHCFVVTKYQNNISPQEDQEGKWVSVDMLDSKIMPEANREIIEVFQQYLSDNIIDSRC
ncbi:8-oxo-dGTP diphosphatase MutT [Cysteiniphilum halobium]|uniref:8-oxo-dGTP diphosphatase MutT n=1 Tax=Cysteiniphilum halobium TaxID=2219059 RepID=UPI000E65117F|nr:8-oxo-dGTP diphosphatase MutT [Cysteiniphilum halobium]